MGLAPASCPAAWANWISNAPFTTNVGINPPVLVTLVLVHNGNATVAINFNDQADGSVGDAGTTTPGSSAPGFTLVPTITGESQTPGFLGWFNISKITTSSGGVLPVETLGFAFTRVDLEYDRLNPGGFDGPGDKRLLGPLQQYGVGLRGDGANDIRRRRPGDAPAETATSFRAPSQTGPSPGGTGAGGGGRATVGEASIGLPVDPSVLNDFILVADGRVTRVSTVDIFTPGGAGPTLFGPYGFTNVVFDSAALSWLSATVGFVAARYSWTVGQNTAVFP